MDKYTLTIKSKTKEFEVSNLTMNGTNYVSKHKIDTSKWPSVFELQAMDAEGNVTEYYENAKLLQQVQYDWDEGKWYLAFAPVNMQEIENAELRSQLAYIAMMVDIDMETGV